MSWFFGNRAKPKSMPVKATARTKVVQASVNGIGSFDFHIHEAPDQYISADIERDRVWEPFETEIFRRLCQPDSSVVDIGANIGWYSVIASLNLSKDGELIAFEPDESNYSVLRSNLASLEPWKNIQTRLEAVGERRATSRLYLSGENLGDHHLFAGDDARDFVDVHVVTLDEVFGSSRRVPSLVKSDTQGSEAKILKGASRLLAGGWRPEMIVEFWPYGLTSCGDDPFTYWSTLRDLGYDVYRVHEHNPKLLKIDESFISNRLSTYLSPESKGHINFLCIPRGSSRIDQLHDLME